MEECGHEIKNEFHWSQKSRGAQAIIIATQDRTSNVAVTYEGSVSTAGSDAIPRLVQLLCGSTITRSVRDNGYLGRNEGVREKDPCDRGAAQCRGMASDPAVLTERSYVTATLLVRTCVAIMIACAPRDFWYQ